MAMETGMEMGMEVVQQRHRQQQHPNCLPIAADAQVCSKSILQRQSSNLPARSSSGVFTLFVFGILACARPAGPFLYPHQHPYPCPGSVLCCVSSKLVGRGSRLCTTTHTWVCRQFACDVLGFLGPKECFSRGKYIDIRCFFLRIKLKCLFQKVFTPETFL